MEADEFRDHISTVNEQGKRVWIFPKRPKGKLYEWRKITSYFLIVFLFKLQLLMTHFVDRLAVDAARKNRLWYKRIIF